MKKVILAMLSFFILIGASVISCYANTSEVSTGAFVEYECGSIGFMISEESEGVIESVRDYYSPDREQVISVLLDPEFLPGDSAKVHFLFDNKIVASGYAPLPFDDVVVWIDNYTAVLLEQYILDARSGMAEKINFGRLSRLKENGNIFDGRAQELVFATNDDAWTIDLRKSTVSPDGKNILYVCDMWLYESDRMCEFYALYEIKSGSFKIIYEHIYDKEYFKYFTGPFTQDFYSVNDAFWKDSNTIIVKFSVEDEYKKDQSISVNIKNGEVEKFLEWQRYEVPRVVSAMSPDGKYWITEAYEPITHCITVSLESEDGLQYKLYEEREDRPTFSFYGNRYLEVCYPKESSVSTIYDLEKWVMFKINKNKGAKAAGVSGDALIEITSYTDSEDLKMACVALSTEPDTDYIKSVGLSYDLLPFFMKNEEVLSDWAEKEVAEAEELGLIPCELQSAYRKNCTREEFCTLVLSLLEARLGKTRYEIMGDNRVTIDPTVFRDTKNEDILRANALGIVNGVGNHMFDPTGEITREQAATMLMRAAKVLGYIQS